MSLKKEVATAGLYNIKSICDGMITAVKQGALPLTKALEVIGGACMDLAERDQKPNQTAEE